MKATFQCLVMSVTVVLPFRSNANTAIITPSSRNSITE